MRVFLLVCECNEYTAIKYSHVCPSFQNSGTTVTMPSSAYLAESLGWESVFYVFGEVNCHGGDCFFENKKK